MNLKPNTAVDTESLTVTSDLGWAVVEALALAGRGRLPSLTVTPVVDASPGVPHWTRHRQHQIPRDHISSLTPGPALQMQRMKENEEAVAAAARDLLGEPDADAVRTI